ncbi:MarR family winged helix-turn-helix transcriptional regulator [Streptomyces kanamyceticus]|uniref:MarR family transcriptional regulator n=1 Tax=Streptomyces kanamyceticus TaxID=1967 RepID=E9KTF2_STRKN|nr:MarR family transcriptional regulator [Streptomyces kanamyceticus]ADU56303.1 transcriptional regulator, MarR family [Streptomyces kanamyceticus]QEU89923.1 MarR family transcriptional regulator [Streptomyces kanamyceticus]
MTDAVDLIGEQRRAECPELADALGAMEIFGRIQRVRRVYDRHFKKLSDTFGLNLGELDMIFTLRRSGPPYTLTAGAFAKAALGSPGAVTNRIDRLKGKGLVERVRESSDRRSVQIRLTRRGETLVTAQGDTALD